MRRHENRSTMMTSQPPCPKPHCVRGLRDIPPAKEHPRPLVCEGCKLRRSNPGRTTLGMSIVL
jgi:hypothetical protein